MFELSIALQYLTPRWRQLSVSIISLISILVIALVVWLVLLFFSVTNGLEKLWTQKLIVLTAPIRITPTDAYFQSYYYKIDSISAGSAYTSKSIGEKAQSHITDPYDPALDQEIPSDWAPALRNSDGTLKDIVKDAFHSISALHGVEGLYASPFEITMANIRLQLIRGLAENTTQSVLSHTIYLGTFDPLNTSFGQVLLPSTADDKQNLHMTIVRNGIGDSHLNTSVDHFILPSDPDLGQAVLLPKGFREVGVLMGDNGFLSYQSTGLSSMQEHRVPIYVSGFYDPGVLPIGGKYVLANSDLVSTIRSSLHSDDLPTSNGIHVHFKEPLQADKVKQQLETAFHQAGIAPYWKIETYREWEFTKDLFQQLQSEKNLWSFLSTIVILVACSNIVSMLIILVNDKRKEIGILRAMGATSWSIGSIFGISGMIMGFLGSVIGVALATVTIHNLDSLVHFFSAVQGFDMLNPMFYGDTLPKEVSADALAFVVTTTIVISLISGVVPAVKAARLRPAVILRSE